MLIEEKGKFADEYLSVNFDHHDDVVHGTACLGNGFRFLNYVRIYFVRFEFHKVSFAPGESGCNEKSPSETGLETT